MLPEPPPASLGLNFKDLVPALSNDVRWRILRELLKEPLPSRVLGARVHAPRNSITKHMRVLCDSGIVVRGYGNVYHLRPELRIPNTPFFDIGVAILRLDRVP